MDIALTSFLSRTDFESINTLPSNIITVYKELEWVDGQLTLVRAFESKDGSVYMEIKRTEQLWQWRNSGCTAIIPQSFVLTNKASWQNFLSESHKNND